MIPKSYCMQFRHDSIEDMEKLNVLCEMLRSRQVCFYITDILIRGKKGYEVFWYIKPEKEHTTRFGVRDRRYH